jgi:hypothetical protein
MGIAKAKEELLAIDVGVSSADAETVQLFYQFGDLLVLYKDWKEQEQEKRFFDVLAFRWQEFEDDAPRNDAAYEVVNSGWLASQAKAQDVAPEPYIHLRICFNGNGVLDVISLKLGA